MFTVKRGFVLLDGGSLRGPNGIPWTVYAIAAYWMIALGPWSAPWIVKHGLVGAALAIAGGLWSANAWTLAHRRPLLRRWASVSRRQRWSLRRSIREMPRDAWLE